MFIKASIILLTMMLLNGCVSKKINYQTTMDNAVKHMSETKKLRLIVREFDLVVYDRLKSELERDNIRRRHAMNLADALKDTAYQIENLIPSELGDNLTKNDLNDYKKYARELYKNGEDIYKIAKDYELEKLQDLIISMENICISCHNQFKVK